MSAPPQTTAGSETVTGTMGDQNELTELIEGVKNLFKTVQVDQQNTGALINASRAYTNWLSKVKFDKPTTLEQKAQEIVSEDAEEALYEIKSALEKLGRAKDSQKQNKTIQEIIGKLKNLATLTSPPVQNDAQAVPGAKQETHGIQEFRNQQYGDEARVQDGHYIAPDYKGPFMNSHTIHDSNKVTGKARVLNGDSYGGKSVFDD